MYDIIFSWYVEAQRELTVSELVHKSKTAKNIRKLTRETARLASKKVRKVYSDRWHEIYDTKLGIVHEPAPEPEVMAPAPEPEVDPLAALRSARAQKEEEHE